ncbi:MAG: general secretion pathway protein GspK [Methylobacter sp.]|nr:MAG: general secretion pathway protein GspK [Methylobacter sp.]
MVLLILSIATVALVSMSSSRQLDIRRTENLLRSSQAFEYVYSLESWAANALRNDSRENKLDSFDDSWTKPLPETAVSGGAMQARLSDLQGRFNLNNLLVEEKPSDLDVQRFKRLLIELKIKPTVVDAILDWIDADSEIRYPDGAEDETYFQQKTPYRSANRLFADVSELLLIHGISQQDYNKLKPYIYVASAYAPINVNTAAPLLLRCLANDLSAKDAELLVRAIKHQPFKTIESFLQQDAIAALGINKQGLGVSSANFLLSGTIRVGKILLLFDTHLNRRENGLITLVKRQRRSPDNG